MNRQTGSHVGAFSITLLQTFQLFLNSIHSWVKYKLCSPCSVSHTGLATMLRPIYEIVRLILKIVQANLVTARLMVMFKTLDLRLQIARGHKQVIHDRATSNARLCHQSCMIMGWQVMRLVWRLIGQPCDWSCHLWNSFTTGCKIYYNQLRLVARP